MKLLLFDIDGTLVHSGGQAKPVFAAAMQEVYGTAGEIDGYDFSGKLDPRIVVDLLAGAGVERETIDGRLDALRENYLARLERSLEPARMRVMPGIRELLPALAGRDDLVLGLLTGNWRGGARIKLGRVGLWDYFPFGSFGDDGLDRRELPPVALDRAHRHSGYAFAPEEAVIVGDSLLDVDCARAHGIPCLAVATGWTEASTLASAGADWVVRDLEGAHGHPAFATRRR